MKCNYCGRQIDDKAGFCSYCGKKVIHVPPVFTMTGLKTDVATEVVRDYTEWGFYNNPDAELDPETGKKPDYGYDALEMLPDENPLKWARDFREAEAAEAAAAAAGVPAGLTPAEGSADSGAEYADGDAEYEESEQTDGDAQRDPKEKTAAKKKRVPVAVIIIAIVVLAAAAAAGAYFLLGKDKTYEVDLSSVMAQPKVIGYDGYGEMALMPQIDEAKEDEWLKTVSFDTEKEEFRKVFETVKYTPDKTKDLSNGDVVNITIEYDKALAKESNLRVTANPLTYEVNGLEIGKDLAYDPDLYHAYYDDFILPESDRAYLTKEDVAYSTDGSADLTQQAINEIYARHGWIFGNGYYDELFRGFDWYTPMYEPEKFDDDWLNDYEKTNLSLLTQYRNELREAEKKAAEEKAAKEAAEKATQKSKSSNSSDEDDD